MEIKKWAKRIAALGTGALMLGATLTGALAYDLKDYPEPFVMNGMLSVTDTVIVVGEAAKTADVLGAVDIAASLQAAAASPAVGTGSIVDPTISEGVKVEKSGDKLNYGDDVADLQTVYDDADLPNLLGGGTLKSKAYTETLTFSTATATVKYDSPGKVNKVEFDAGNFLNFPTGNQVYQYDLAMESTLNEEAGDVSGKTFDIQGRKYTISDINYGTDGDYDDMTLMAGSTTSNLEQDVPMNVGDKTVTLISVNDGATTCLLSVDGSSGTIDVGDSEIMGGLTIGVLSAFSGDTVKTCEVTLGADKLVLNHNGKVEKNGVDVDGTVVTLDGNNTAKTFDSIRIVYSTDKDDFDDYKQWFAPGEAWEDPVFGNFQLLFDGISAKTEDIMLDRSADEATFTFKNTKGEDVVVDFYSEGSTVTFGDSTSGPLLFQAVANQNATFNGTISRDTDTYPDTKLWYVLAGGEVHVLQFSDFDDDNNKLEFEDLTSGKDVKTAALTGIVGVLEHVTLGSLGTIQVAWDGNNVLWFNATGVTAESMYGAEIAPTTVNNTGQITITSPDEDSTVQAADEVFTLGLQYDGTNTELDVIAPTTGGTFHKSGGNKDYNDNNVLMYMSAKGAMFEYDNDDKSFVYLTYPEEDVYANVFISPAGLAAAGGAVGDGSAVTLNRFGVKLAVLDSDAEGMTKNMIVVGGPCANTIAFELMDEPDDCAEGFEAGKAMLKFFDRSGKAALLVAGAGADDTRGAAYVLAKYSDYTLVGDEVEVVSADLEDLSVV